MFDGVPWGAPALVPPYAYAPWAPCAPDAVASSLINAYYAAHANAQKLVEQVYPFDDTSPANAGERFAQSVTLLEQAGGYVWLDATITHLVGFLIIEVITSFETTAFQRVRLDDGIAFYAGPTSERPIAANAAMNGSVMGGTLIPNEEVAGNLNGGLFVTECEMDLRATKPTLDQRVYVSLEAYATSLAVATHRVRAACILAEVR